MVRSAAINSSNSSSAFAGALDRFEVAVLPVGIEEPAAFWYAFNCFCKSAISASFAGNACFSPSNSIA